MANLRVIPGSPCTRAPGLLLPCEILLGQCRHSLELCSQRWWWYNWYNWGFLLSAEAGMGAQLRQHSLSESCTCKSPSAVALTVSGRKKRSRQEKETPAVSYGKRRAAEHKCEIRTVGLPWWTFSFPVHHLSTFSSCRSQSFKIFTSFIICTPRLPQTARPTQEKLLLPCSACCCPGYFLSHPPSSFSAEGRCSCHSNHTSPVSSKGFSLPLLKCEKSCCWEFGNHLNLSESKSPQTTFKSCRKLI